MVTAAAATPTASLEGPIVLWEPAAAPSTAAPGSLLLLSPTHIYQLGIR
jgi:hypothetical protein